MAAGGGGTALAAGLSRKLRKVLNETRTDSPELLASLEALSSFYGENTPGARRALKSTIERRALALNHDFLLASLPAQQVAASPSPPLYPTDLVVYLLSLSSLLK